LVGAAWRGGILLASVALFGAAWVGHAQLIQDNFNDDDDVGWLRYDPIGSHPQLPDIASFEVVDGRYHITTTPSPAPTTVGPGRAGALRQQQAYADFYISVDVVDFNDTVNQVFGILARIASVGLGTTTGYALTWDRGGQDLDISRIAGEVPSGVAGTDASLVRGRSYRFVFIGQGAQLTGKVYELPNTTTPLATVTGTDATYPGGIGGLVTYDNSGGTGITDVTFDNYLSLETEPPPLTVTVNTFLEVEVSWPIRGTSFDLYKADRPDAPEGEWVRVPGDQINESQTTLSYIEDASMTAYRYFRLKHR
jgi:hypothetical protein